MGFTFNQISIIGVGLMGGSLGMVLRKRKLTRKIIGVGRNIHRLKLAKKLGAIDQGTTDWKEGVKNAEIVVICTPVGEIIPSFKKIIQSLPSGCIITDVGSTKETIVSGIQKIINSQKKNVYFVGSHPMAGSEQFGIEAAKENLYQNALCMLTPTKGTNKKAEKKIELLWKSVGSHIMVLTPKQHDESVAAISHLPHVLAAVLVNTIVDLEKQNGRLTRMASTGFRDTTRIAASHPQIWTDICLGNKQSILKVLDLFERELNDFKKILKQSKNKKIYKKFESASKFRAKLS